MPRATSQPHIQPAKKFSKVKLFEDIGFLNRRFNYETKQFERSTSLFLYSQLVLWMKVTLMLR